MAEDRTITCYEDPNHTWIVLLGLLGLVMVPLPLAASAAYLTLRYRVCMTGSSAETS